MKEKFKEYRIDHPLTAGRRQKINRFIKSNASRLGRPFSHQWDESGTVLLLASDPVEWKLIFHPTRLEVIGSAPLWVKMLFTEKRRNTVNAVILQMLEETGFVAASPPESTAKEPPAAPSRARKKTSSR